MRLALILGTRPEAIKMAPVIQALQGIDGFSCRVWSTGQHRQMLDQALAFFDIKTDLDLGVMAPGQTLNHVFARVVAGVDEHLVREQPDMVLVHGDTSTAAAAAVAAFHRRIRVAHVEAGLRSGSMDQPFPEEFNRRLVDMVSDRMFAPTNGARDNLLAEGADPSRIVVTGNTVVDALLHAVERTAPGTDIRAGLDREFAFLDPDRPLVLVTGHRRENFGDGFSNICEALRRLAEDGRVQIVYPVHLNPAVKEPVRAMIGDRPNIHLIDPVAYPAFVYLMSRARVILTDSGGVQEEAATLGKPLLVMRNVTERPESIANGVGELVGTDPDRIVDRVLAALEKTVGTGLANPYGDGRASARIAEELRRVAKDLH